MCQKRAQTRWLEMTKNAVDKVLNLQGTTCRNSNFGLSKAVSDIKARIAAAGRETNFHLEETTCRKRHFLDTFWASNTRHDTTAKPEGKKLRVSGKTQPN